MVKRTLTYSSILIGICLFVPIIIFIMYYNGAFTDLTVEKTTEELVVTVALYYDYLDEPYLERAVLIDKDKLVTGLYTGFDKITYVDREKNREITLIEENSQSTIGLKLFRTMNGEILNEDVWKYLKISAQYNYATPFYIGYLKNGDFYTEPAYKIHNYYLSDGNEIIEYIKMNNKKIYSPVIDIYGRLDGITIPTEDENTICVVGFRDIMKLLEQ